MNGPLLLIRATITFATLGITTATRLLGRRRGLMFIGGGMVVSTLVAIILEAR